MKWGVLVVLAAIWAVGCRGKETGSGDARGGREAHQENWARSDESEAPVLWRTHEEFLRLIETGDDELRSRIVEALREEFVVFAAEFEDLDAAVVEFANVHIEGAEEGPERDRVLDLLFEGALPEGAYRGKLRVVLTYYSFPGSKRGRVMDIMEMAFEIDPEWVFSTAVSLEEPEYRDAAYWSATRALCEKCESLREAIAMARGFTGNEMPGEVLTTIGECADNWEEAKPENLGETLAEILGAITVAQAARDEFVSTIMRTWSDRNLAETVAVFQDLGVRDREAWDFAARDASEVTLENASLFLEAIPEGASVVNASLLSRLEKTAGAEEVFDLIAGLPAERQEWAVPYAIYGYAKEIGLSEALENVRERLSPSAYRRAVERLDGYSGHLSEADRALVKAAFAEGNNQERQPDDD